MEALRLDTKEAQTLIDSKEWRDDTDEGSEFCFETFGEDIKKVQSTNPNKVWTVTDEDGELLLCKGIRFVNRIYYMIER